MSPRDFGIIVDLSVTLVALLLFFILVIRLIYKLVYGYRKPKAFKKQKHDDQNQVLELISFDDQISTKGNDTSTKKGRSYATN